MTDTDMLRSQAISLTDELYGECRHLTGIPNEKLADCNATKKQEIADVLNAIHQVESDDGALLVAPAIKGLLMATLQATNGETIEHFFLKEIATFMHTKREAIDALYMTNSLSEKINGWPQPLHNLQEYKDPSQYTPAHRKRYAIQKLVSYTPDRPSLAEALIESLREEKNKDAIEITTYIISLASTLNPDLRLPTYIGAFAPKGLS